MIVALWWHTQGCCLDLGKSLLLGGFFLHKALDKKYYIWSLLHSAYSNLPSHMKKMLHRSLPILLIGCISLLLTSSGQAQVKDYSYKRTAEEKKRGRAFRNNFFRQRAISSLTDYFVIPQVFNEATITHSDGTVYEYDEVPIRGGHLGLFSYTYEFRYNWFNYRDYFSISTAVPITVAFAAPLSIGEDYLFSRLPLYVDLNFFATSTYNNIHQSGYFVGAGRQMVTAGLLSSHRRSHGEWVFRSGFKYPGKAVGKISYLYFEFGYGPGGQLIRNRDGSTERQVKSYSFRLALGKVLKY